MQESGLVEIFSHSKRHLFYDKLPVRQVRDDVTKSYKIIEEKLGKKDLKVFAYPYGAFTKETVWALKISGIDMQLYDIGINNFKNFNKDYIICSHAFINTIIFSKDARIQIDLAVDKKILIQRFKKRENITENTFDKNIEIYYKSYEEVLKDNNSNILDTTDKDIIEKINNLI